MTANSFIFSEKTSIKLLRHASFWVVCCIDSFYNGLYPTNSLNQLADWKLYYNSFISFIFFLPGLMFIVYISLYALIPRFIFRKKYPGFILAVACLLVFNVYFDYLLAQLTSDLFNISKEGEILFLNTWTRAFIKGFQNGVTLIGVAVSIKLGKYWYLKQLENRRLEALKIDNERKILKSNIRPDFLLYSLDNLRKKIKTSYTESAEMILNLSELFSFILYDVREELVPLEKEINAVENLIAVENIIHDNQVEIDISVDITNGYSFIPPLLLFSFLQKLFAENEVKNKKFKNIYIYIQAVADTLSLTFTLNYFEKITIEFIPPEKLNDTEKQLYALYNKFEITRNEKENSYTINIHTPLYEQEKIKT